MATDSEKRRVKLASEPIGVQILDDPRARLVGRVSMPDYLIDRLTGAPEERTAEAIVLLNQTAASAYSELISDQLNEARGRANSIQQRAISVITTSGTLVTLIFAFGALSRAVKSVGPATTTLPPTSLGDPAREFLVGSLVLFAVAVGLALYIQSRPFEVGVSGAGFDQMMNDGSWELRDPVIGALRVAEARVALARQAREIAIKMDRFLNIAILVEILAVIALAITVGAILFES